MNSIPSSLEEVRERAGKKLKAAKVCMVYKDCDGNPNQFCQGQHYGRPLGFGGIGSGASFHNNWLALRKIKLKKSILNYLVDLFPIYKRLLYVQKKIDTIPKYLG